MLCAFQSTATSRKFYAEVRQSFLASFKKDQNLQMTVQGLGTQTWLLQGRVRLIQEVHLRNLRKPVRKILLKCQNSLGLPPASNQEFGKYLEKELHVTPDEAPFSGESHWWTPESPFAVLGESAATAAEHPPATARALLGAQARG